MATDKICKFLCIDLCDLVNYLFHDDDEPESVEKKNETTAGGHNYPPRLITYDAEELGEPRLIRFSDLNENLVELLMSQSEEEEREEKNCQVKKKKSQVKVHKEECDQDKEDDCQMKCEMRSQKNRTRQTKCKTVQKKPRKAACKSPRRECKPKIECDVDNELETRKWKEQLKWAQLNKLLTDAFAALCPGEQLSKKNLKFLETSAKRIHTRFINSQTAKEKALPPGLKVWECLQPMQKFRYYWEALTKNKLQPSPYANFREVFIKRYRRTYGDTHNLHSKVFHCWRMQKCNEQLPFILNALLYQISIGTVDPYDSSSIRGLINLWSRQPMPVRGKGSIDKCLSGCFE
ncbi:uncharacterized protein LOC133838055 [Drosophila sulfurigaster albostrigata]|uniref:uncharacterized protein LOC133838055 n=1 Tax=Drosophila sulfurigaster albostrigata TaxID=89887 RepID=UPI002D21B9AA|nr:uncharacterized protein LOC133838055 [Drosophila sulfurigaster albostrigata]